MRMQKLQVYNDWKHEQTSIMCSIMYIYNVEVCRYCCIPALRMSTVFKLKMSDKQVKGHIKFLTKLGANALLFSLNFDSLYRLHSRDLWGQAVGDFPALLRGLFWPELLLQSLLRRTHGVSGPGLWYWRRGAYLDHRSEVPDGWYQWWRQSGQAAAHTRPISLIDFFTIWLDPESFMQSSFCSYLCCASCATFLNL